MEKVKIVKSNQEFWDKKLNCAIFNNNFVKKNANTRFILRILVKKNYLRNFN